MIVVKYRENFVALYLLQSIGVNNNSFISNGVLTSTWTPYHLYVIPLEDYHLFSLMLFQYP